MDKLIKIEKALFYFLSLAFFWQLRLIWAPAGRQFNEWTSSYLYATDLIIAGILILWIRRETYKKIEGLKSPRSPSKGGERLPPFREGWGGFVAKKNIVLVIFLLFSALSLFLAQDKFLGFYRLAKILAMVYCRCGFAKHRGYYAIFCAKKPES